jgi:competence protein ComEC
MFPTINWQSVPFIRLVLPFAFGIWCNNQIEQPLPYPILLLVLMLIFSLGILKVKFKYYQPWITGLWSNVPLFLLGWQLVFWHNPTTSATHYQQFISTQQPTAKHWAIGEVVTIPTTKKTTKVEISIREIGNHPDSLMMVDGRLLCYVEADSLSSMLKYGDKVLFHAFINMVESPKNPNQFDYQQFLKYQGITHQAYLSAGSWQVLTHEKNDLFYHINQFRADRIQQIKTYFKGEAEQGVAMALLLGFKDELSEDIRAAYAETGAIHVLAVSGLHVGIIAMILRWLLLHFYWRRKWLKLLLLIVPLWMYALLTGFSPSVIRATVMFSLLILGLEIGRKPSIYNVLAASAFVLLLFNPYFLFSVGFQLSYAAVVGIVYFQPKIAIWFLPKNKIVHYFWQLTTVSIAATLGTLPFTLYYFHQFPVWFWLSSAVVIPAAAVILSIGILFFAIGWIPFFGVLIGQVLEWIIALMNSVIGLIHALPLSLIKGLWLSNWMFYILLFAIVGFGLLLQTRWIRWSVFTLSFILSLSIFSVYNDWQASTQKAVVVYSIANATAIDFIDGQHILALKSKNLSSANYAFATQGYHYKSNIKHIDTLSIEDDSTQPHFQKSNGLIQFYDKTFLIVEQGNIVIQEPLTVDYILIRNTPRLSIKDLMAHFDCQQLIIDGSNKYWQIQKWQKECEQLGITVHDVQQDNAFILQL